MIWWSLIVVCYAANLRDTPVSLVELKETTESPITITGTIPSGMAFTMSVDTNDLVSSLRSKVEAATGMPQDQQRFIFGTKQLDDDYTLGSYGIKNGSKLKVVIRLR
jgi:hypothetical protein